MLRIRVFYILWFSVLCTIDKLHAEYETCNDELDHDSKTNLESKVNQILTKLDRESSILHNEEVVLVLGSSSSKADFLVDLITEDNNNLISYFHENKWVVLNPDFTPLNQPRFSNLLNIDTSTGTAFLKFPVSQQKSTIYEDLVSKYYIWRIIRQAKSVKFLLVVSSDLQDGSEMINFSDFKNLVTTTASFITDIEKFENSFALVVTNVENKGNQNAQLFKNNLFNNLEEIFKFFVNNENKKGYKIVSSLIDSNSINQTNKIEILLKPTETATVSEIHSLQYNKMSIKSMLKRNIKSVDINNNDFDYSYYLQTQNKLDMNIITDFLEEKIQKRIKRERCKINSEILKYFQDYEKRTHDIQILKEFYKTSLHNITQFEISITQDTNRHNQDIVHEKRVVKELVQFIRNSNMEISEKNFIKILHSYKYLEFIEAYKSFKIRSFLPNWELNETKKFIEDSEKWYTFLNDFYLMLSDYVVQKNREKKIFSIKEIEDVCINKLKLVNLEEGLNRFQERYVHYKDDKSPKYQISNKLKDVDVSEVKLQQLCKVYEQTLLEELQYNCFGDTLQIKQEFIRFDQIPPTNYCVGGTKRLELFAFDTLFINENLIRVGEELEVVAIAPKWVVYGNRHIVLDGINGKEHERSKAPDSFTPGFDGEDGQPGHPGGPAGSFLGIGHKLFSITDAWNEQTSLKNTLIISANGGTGGKGQDGGNGAKGKDGMRGMIDYEKQYQQISGYGELPSGMKPCEFEKDPKTTAYCLMNIGSPGYPNGAGGEGGKGGLAGPGGSIHFFLSFNHSDIHVVKYNAKGFSGKGGIGGLGGNGSVNGLSYYDLYNRWEQPPAGRWKHKVIYNRINITELPRIFLPKGSDGESNKNSEGIENPKSAQLTQFPLSVNRYKILLREKLSSDIESGKLMNFYKILNNESSEEVNLHEIDDTLGFVNELQGLEEQFFKLHNQLDFLPFYKSLLRRVENYSKNPKSKENNKEYKKILVYLYTAILSKICTFENKAYNYLIVDIRKELAFVSENVQEVLIASNQLSRYKINKKFKSDIDNKIKETNQFVKTIEAEVHKINKKLQSELKILTNATVSQEKSTTGKLDNDVNKKEATEKKLVVKGVFEVLKGISLLAGFCGPWGAIAGGLLETGDKYIEPLVLQPMTKEKARDFVVKNSIDMVLIAKNHIGSIADQLWATQKEGLKQNIESLKNKEKELPDLKETRVKLEDISKGDPLSDKSALDQSQEVISEEEENLNNAMKELKHSEDAYNKKKEILDYLGKLQKLNRIYKSGFEWTKSVNTKNDEIERIESEITADKSKIRKLDDFQNDIHEMIMPMLRSMRQEVDDLEKNLASKSSVSLDVTKWKVDETLTSIKKRLKAMTKDFPQISEVFGNLVQKLIDTLNTLINVFERMEQYQDRKVLVDYIAQINSPSIKNLNVDENLNYAVTYLKILLETNAILDPYVRTMKTFKQHVFPFANFYMAEFGLPEDLDINDMNSVRSTVIHQMTRLLKNLDKTDVSVLPQIDQHIYIGEFSTENLISGPFYTWKNSQFQLQIGELLYGKKIILGADINNGLQKNAVKFKTIELKFIATNPSLQHNLDELLKKFHVTMTHSGNSYYRCGSKQYIITTSKQTFSYSSQKKSDKVDAFETSLSYLKLKQGDFILSPYTVWEIQLKSEFEYAFDELKDYRHKVDIALVGFGQYLDTEIDVCDSDLYKYYKEETKGISETELLYDYEAQEYINTIG